MERHFLSNSILPTIEEFYPRFVSLTDTFRSRLCETVFCILPLSDVLYFPAAVCRPPLNGATTTAPDGALDVVFIAGGSFRVGSESRGNFNQHQREEQNLPDNDTKDAPNRKTAAFNRRSMLLAGSTLAAASAIGTNSPVQAAQAQAQPRQQAAAAGKKPNILVIFGDDIGITNLSAYARADGLRDAEHRPDRKRGHPFPPLLWRAMLHRRPFGVPHRVSTASAPASPKSASRVRRWA